jgi:hypothetical protein
MDSEFQMLKELIERTDLFIDVLESREKEYRNHLY